jgi:hypothetical protein
MKLSTLTALALLLASPAFAQSVPLQSGPVTPGHAPMYVNQGSGQPIVTDGGGAANGAIGKNLSELGITARSQNSAYPVANGGKGALNSHFCLYDAPTTNPTGYHYLCLDPNAAGGGLLSYGASGTAAPLPLYFDINGVTTVAGGTSTLIAVGSTFVTSGTSGQLLYDKAGVLGGLTVSGDATLNTSTGALTVTETNGTPFGALATAATVNLSTQASGTLQAAQEPAHTGDVTNTAGSLATTIASGAVTSGKMASGAAAINLGLGPSGQVRPQLIANTTLYVASTGSDSNPGTSASPFLTIAHALSVAASYDGSIYNLTVQVGDGSWPAITLPAMIGSGVFSLICDTATPTSCVIAGITAVGALVSWTVNGFEFAGGANGIYSQYNAYIILGTATVFGACSTSHMTATNGGRIRASSYTISGGAAYHIQGAQLGGITVSGATVTLSGTPAFTDFAYNDTLSLIQFFSVTFSGSATGSRYSVNGNSVINTYGGGASFLPGSTAGSVTNGVYE